MIHVFYGCGSFGSTIEYVLKTPTLIDPLADLPILADGSMHLFDKQCHITEVDDVETILSLGDNSITTPIYPLQTLKLPDLIDLFRQLPSWQQDYKILIYQPNLEAVEINLLFQYHKVCAGSVVKMGLAPIVGNNSHNIRAWNPNYTNWNQMQTWELREWLSIFYPEYAQELNCAIDSVDSDWFTISNTDILYHPQQSFKAVLDFCKLQITTPIDQFASNWKTAQQYVVDEFDLVAKIVDSAVGGKEFAWKEMNIVAEAIVQQRLRQKGFEIKCDGLNIFPTNAAELHKLLYKH